MLLWTHATHPLLWSWTSEPIDSLTGYTSSSQRVRQTARSAMQITLGVTTSDPNDWWDDSYNWVFVVT
jgi:hypothetical protein